MIRVTFDDLSFHGALTKSYEANVETNYIRYSYYYTNR